MLFTVNDLGLLNNDYRFSKYLGNRDRQVLRQTLMTFASILAFRKQPLTILEIGVGLSTLVISDLLSRRNDFSKLISYDLRGKTAFIENTRDVNIDIDRCLESIEFREESTCTYKELVKFYTSNQSTVGNLQHKQLLDGLDCFVDYSMDDRKLLMIEQLLGMDGKTSFINDLRSHFLENGLFSSPIFELYRSNDCEFTWLGEYQPDFNFEKSIENESIDIVYFDSGEFSSVLEFNKLEKFLKVGSILVLQDILFPKSIKSFLIGSFLVMSPNYQIIWQDNTTPQGILVAKKIKY